MTPELIDHHMCEARRIRAEFTLVMVRRVIAFLRSPFSRRTAERAATAH